MKEKYIKSLYRSEPIGKYQIVLELITFDLEAFKKDEKLEKIPTKKSTVVYNFDNNELLNPNLLLRKRIEKRFTEIFEKTYKTQLEDMSSYIEYLRKNGIPQAQWIDSGSDKK